MEVKITFDTEKESAEDLRKLVAALHDLIAKKENNSNTNLASSHNISNQNKLGIKDTKEESKKPTVNYAGSGKIIPFEDIRKTMSDIFSGKKC